MEYILEKIKNGSPDYVEIKKGPPLVRLIAMQVNTSTIK